MKKRGMIMDHAASQTRAHQADSYLSSVTDITILIFITCVMTLS